MKCQSKTPLNLWDSVDYVPLYPYILSYEISLDHHYIPIFPVKSQHITNKSELNPNKSPFNPNEIPFNPSNSFKSPLNHR